MAEVEKTTAATLADTDSPAALFKKKGTKRNARKKAPTPPPQSQSDEPSDNSDYDDGSGRSVKRRRKNIGAVTASSAQHKSADQHELSASTFAADRSVPITNNDSATRKTNWYDEESNTKPGPARNAGRESQTADGTYKGLAKDGPSRSVGPMKATNVRTTIAVDYSPDVCKDYKTTGYCGFGDSCKFLHDRSDYKQGWQLDRDWETVTKGKKIAGTVISSANKGKTEDVDEDEEAMLENIPFACVICKGDYKAPIVTKCGHYFCEPCALGRYRKDPSCAACGSGTNGVFNSAKKLKKLLERKRERQQAEASHSDDDEE